MNQKKQRNEKRKLYTKSENKINDIFINEKKKRSTLQ